MWHECLVGLYSDNLLVQIEVRYSGPIDRSRFLSKMTRPGSDNDLLLYVSLAVAEPEDWALQPELYKIGLQHSTRKYNYKELYGVPQANSRHGCVQK